MTVGGQRLAAAIYNRGHNLRAPPRGWNLSSATREEDVAEDGTPP